MPLRRSTRRIRDCERLDFSGSSAKSVVGLSSARHRDLAFSEELPGNECS
jgi:hypothetical protein